MSKARAALWLWVIVLGVAFGAGLYEHRIVTPRWLVESSNGDATWRPDVASDDDTGLRFWAFVSTGPLTLLTLINGVLAWRTRGPARQVWLVAAGFGAAERAMTFGYFIPTMVRLMDMPDSPTAVAIATTWLAANHVRHALACAAWVLALRTLETNGAGGAP